MNEERALIQQTLDALERLMRMFAVERFLYLACGVLSFGLLAYCVVSLFILDADPDFTQLSLIFGSSGLIAASAARVSYFLNKSFDLVADVVRAIANLGEKPSDGANNGD